MKILEKIDQYLNEKQSYKEFFEAKLKEMGKSIDDMSDEEKKKFFNMIDKEWKADNEEA